MANCSLANVGYVVRLRKRPQSEKSEHVRVEGGKCLYSLIYGGDKQANKHDKQANKVTNNYMNVETDIKGVCLEPNKLQCNFQKKKETANETIFVFLMQMLDKVDN